MNKIIKYFSIILCSAFFMFLLTSKPIEANYDREKNNVSVSATKDAVTINVTYQRGFIADASSYLWCEHYDADVAEGDCTNKVVVDGNSVNPILYATIGEYNGLSYIAKGDATYVDEHPTYQTFVVPKTNDAFLNKLNDHAEREYTLLVSAFFCTLRTESGEEYNGCARYDVKYTAVKFKTNDLINSHSIGTNIEDIEDEDIQTLMEKISSIVYDTVLPIIWIVLGLFLVVKGALLGVQIVKAADEPQIRQEKIGSLKWLVIGVAIAALATGAVQALTGFFSGAFGGGK